MAARAAALSLSPSRLPLPLSVAPSLAPASPPLYSCRRTESTAPLLPRPRPAGWAGARARGRGRGEAVNSEPVNPEPPPGGMTDPPVGAPVVLECRIAEWNKLVGSRRRSRDPGSARAGPAGSLRVLRTRRTGADAGRSGGRGSRSAWRPPSRKRRKRQAECGG